MKKLLVMACSVFTFWSQAQSLRDSLIICMPMDNTANDFSGYNNHGTLVGGVSSTFGHTGLANTAYHLNGTNGYINIPTSSSIDRVEQLSELSVSIWVKITAWSVATPVSKIFPIMERFDPVSDNGWSYDLLDPASYSPDVLFYSDGLYGTPNYFFNLGVTLGSWKHYVLVYSKSGDYCKYYVDGVLIQTFSTLTAPTGLFNTKHGDIRIGFSEEGIDEYGNGDVDDLRVYDRPLSDLEVAALFSTEDLTCESDPDINGDGGGGGKDCCLGNLCKDSKNALKGDYEIPMKTWNFNYTMPRNSASEVLIGYTGCTTGTARLDVKDDMLGTAVKGLCATSNMNNIGVHGIGVNTRGEDSGNTFGVVGESGLVYKRGYSAGVAGFCGGAAALSALPFGEDIGVYGNSTANGGAWAGYFDGDVKVNGSGWVTGTWIWSDKRFKTNIKPLENVTDRIKKLSGYTYNFNTDAFKKNNFDKNEQIGFIAQELKEVFPQLVKEDTKGFLAVNYEGMVPVLLQAFKEQAEQNATQQQQIDELKAMVNAMAGKTNSETKVGTTTPVTLSDKNIVVLNQNVPNPFAESTVISYNIPADFLRAQVIFTNESGVVIKAIDIKEKGQGTLSVFANDLSHGMYSYTLIVDDKKIDTKKMIKD